MSYSRPPPDVEGMTSLKVDFPSDRTSPETLRRLFEKYGRVGDVYVPRDWYTKESRGFAFVRFHDKRDAEDAIDAMDGALLDGRELRVQMAWSHHGGGGGGGPARRSYSPSPRRRRRSRSRSRSRYSTSRYRSYSRSKGRRRRSRSRSRSRYSRSRYRSYSRSKSGSPQRKKTNTKSRSRSKSRPRSRTAPGLDLKASPSQEEAKPHSATTK